MTSEWEYNLQEIKLKKMQNLGEIRSTDKYK